MAVMSTRNNGTKRQWAQGIIEDSKARRDSHPSPLPQWLPKPATSQSPHEERSLRETWSPLRVEGVSNRRAREGLSGSVADQAGNDECRMTKNIQVRSAECGWRNQERETEKSAALYRDAATVKQNRRDLNYGWIRLATGAVFEGHGGPDLPEAFAFSSLDFAVKPPFTASTDTGGCVAAATL